MESNGLFSLRNKSLSGSKRIKISRACDECRKRKVKCDGVQPCGRCKKSNAECVFAKLPPKRGPPKQYMENLENRLQRVEKALKSMTAQETFDEMPVEKSVQNTIPLEVLGNDMDKFTINDIGQAVYTDDNLRIPKNDIHHEHQNVTLSDISDSPMSSSAASFYHPPPPIIVTNQIQVSEMPIPIHLSSRDLISEVQPWMDIYFDRVHKYVPMIHKPTFLKQMHSSDPPSRLLLYAMCAVASKWSPDQITVTNSEIPPGYAYYRKVLGLIDDFVDYPRVSTIQALILIVKYQEYFQRTGYHHRSCFYLGMAAQMCIDLGLQQLEGESYDVEIKKRTFWITFTYDLLLSIEQGHKPYFDVHRCTTGFPLVTGEEGPALEELTTNQNILIQLCKILSDIYAMSRRITARQQAQGEIRSKDQIIEEQARLFSLHTHLENFLYEIPPSLIYPPTQDKENYPVEKQAMVDPFIGFLHMAYHFSVILLHSHYARHPLQETEFSFVEYPHRRLCATSASNITGSVEAMFDLFPKYVFHYPPRGVQYTVHCLAMAAHIHKYEMENAEEDSLRVSARLQYFLTVDLMQTLADQSPSAEFSKYRHHNLSTAEKRMSAPVFPQSFSKPKNRRNTFSSNDPALYQSSASITDPAQLASILQQQNFMWPVDYQPMPMTWQQEEDKQKVYYDYPQQQYEDDYTIKQEYDANLLPNMNMMMMPEDDIMLDTNSTSTATHQYDPTSGMSQLFLTDHRQISWPSVPDVQRSEGHVMK